MSKVYVVTVIEGEWTRERGVFDNPFAAILAISNRTCNGDVTITVCEIGRLYVYDNIVFHSEASGLRASFDEVFEGRFDAPHYFPAVKERYQTAEELFEARRNQHCMGGDVARGFSAIMKGLFSDEEIVTMYEKMQYV